MKRWMARLFCGTLFVLVAFLGVRSMFYVSVWSEVPKAPKPNVFAEIYQRCVEGTVPYEWTHPGKVWNAEWVTVPDGTTTYRCKPNSSDFRRLYPACTPESRLYLQFREETKSFSLWCCADSESEAEKVFTYYAAWDRLAYESSEEKDCIMNWFLTTWLDRTQGRSNFSYGSWGTVRLMEPV